MLTTYKYIILQHVYIDYIQVDMGTYNELYTFLALRCYEEKLGLRKQMLWKVPTHLA